MLRCGIYLHQLLEIAAMMDLRENRLFDPVLTDRRLRYFFLVYTVSSTLLFGFETTPVIRKKLNEVVWQTMGWRLAVAYAKRGQRD